MRLGAEFIELMQVIAPEGRPIPVDSQSNDLWFQHIAIITPDMARAYAWLREHEVRHSSPAPHRLPDWGPDAGASRPSIPRTRTATISRSWLFPRARAIRSGRRRASACSSASITLRSRSPTPIEA